MTLPTPEPPENPEAAPYREGLTAGRLVLPRCDACEQLVWYPRSWCPACGNETVTWTELSGRGTVYARTIVRRSFGAWADAAPYLVAYVELAEGPRLLVNIEAADPDAVQIGAPVVARYVPIPDTDGALLRFAPEG